MVSNSEEFDVRASDYQLRSNWSSSPEVAAAAVQLLTDRDLGSLLDAGGGTGFLADYVVGRLGAARTVVLDESLGMLSHVPPGLVRVAKAIEALDASDGMFDTILLRQVLHYVEDPADVLRVLSGRLAASGVMYVGQIVAPDPVAADWLQSVARAMSPNRRRVWTPVSLLSLISRSGLSLTRGSIVPHVDALSSWVSRSAQQVDPREWERLLGTLTPELCSAMDIQHRGAGLQYRLYWMHCLVTVAPARK
ncbi:methyltransferase domain-containing protein [Actinoplanes sp. NPDC051851]|uniref:class I SAM-dependent methyltransferase n=1 Tax=Actinoplanes sp. NPDC051851 TaxID=3154753 RepID=UPI003449D4C6